MKIATALIVFLGVLAGCTDRGQLAPLSSYQSLRMPWQKRADPPTGTVLESVESLTGESVLSPQSLNEGEAPPIAAPRDSVISEPAPPSARRS
jgi:hypothetical protein